MHSFALFLNDVAGTEIFLIFLVILLFFGSKSIPGIAKSMGKALFEFRNASNDLKDEIKKSGDRMKGDLNLKETIQEAEEEIVKPMDQAFTDVENAVHYTVPKNINITNQKSTKDVNQSGNNNGEQVGSTHHEGS